MGRLFRQRDLDLVIGAKFGRFVGMFHHLGRVLSRLLFGDGAARSRLALFAPALADVCAGAGFVGVDQNSDDSCEQHDFSHSGLGEDEHEPGGHAELQTPLLLHRRLAQPHGGGRNQSDHRRVEPLKDALRVGDVFQVTVCDGQPDHRQKRRQYEAGDRHQSAANSAELQPDVRDRVGGVGARQALRQRNRVEELFLRHPPVFINHQAADVRDHRQPAAEAGQAQFEESFGERALIYPFGARGRQPRSPLAPEAARLAADLMIEVGQRRKRRRF